MCSSDLRCRSRGQRLYTRREIDTVLRIKELLYRDGFTIAGAKKKLEEGDSTEPAAVVQSTPAPARSDVAKALVTVKSELTAILRMLEE